MLVGGGGGKGVGGMAVAGADVGGGKGVGGAAGVGVITAVTRTVAGTIVALGGKALVGEASGTTGVAGLGVLVGALVVPPHAARTSRTSGHMQRAGTRIVFSIPLPSLLASHLGVTRRINPTVRSR